jgi:DNA-directed RNA polymerase specialized sigma subunit, sigma24 homolog
MLTERTMTNNEGCTEADGQAWYDLYSWLLPLAEMWVREAHVASWYGQQREIAEDIAHEAVLRTFRYQQRAECGELAPIGSYKALSRVIARNYFRDWRKKDWCLVRIVQIEEESSVPAPHISVHDIVDVAQVALDNLMLDAVILSVAQIIATFPKGQKTALLTDLANIADLDQEEPSLLEQALSSVDLHLSDYKQSRSPDPVVRGRGAALRSIAYKRLKNEIQI